MARCRDTGDAASERRGGSLRLGHGRSVLALTAASTSASFSSESGNERPLSSTMLLTASAMARLDAIAPAAKKSGVLLPTPVAYLITPLSSFPPLPFLPPSLHAQPHRLSLKTEHGPGIFKIKKIGRVTISPEPFAMQKVREGSMRALSAGARAHGPLRSAEWPLRSPHLQRAGLWLRRSFAPGAPARRSLPLLQGASKTTGAGPRTGPRASMQHGARSAYSGAEWSDQADLSAVRVGGRCACALVLAPRARARARQGQACGPRTSPSSSLGSGPRLRCMRTLC